MDSLRAKLPGAKQDDGTPKKKSAKEIFAEKKQLIRKKHVMIIDVPKYDELSVKNLYKKLLALDNMEKYFPDSYCKGRSCDRGYMFNVANTLHTGVVQELIDHALKQRHNPKLEQNKSESIMISEKWMEELNSLPLVNKVSLTVISIFDVELLYGCAAAVFGWVLSVRDSITVE